MHRCPCLLVPMLLTRVSRWAAAASADSFSDDCETGERFGKGIRLAGGEGELSHLLITGWNAENLRLDDGSCCMSAGWYGFSISKLRWCSISRRW